MYHKPKMCLPQPKHLLNVCKIVERQAFTQHEGLKPLLIGRDYLSSAARSQLHSQYSTIT